MDALASGMLPIKVPASLPQVVKAAFNRAKTSGDLTYFPTKVTILDVNSIPVSFNRGQSESTSAALLKPPQNSK